MLWINTCTGKEHKLWCDTNASGFSLLNLDLLAPACPGACINNAVLELRKSGASGCVGSAHLPEYFAHKVGWIQLWECVTSWVHQTINETPLLAIVAPEAVAALPFNIMR